MSDVNCDDKSRVFFNIPDWLTFLISDLVTTMIYDRQKSWYWVVRDYAGYTQLILGLPIRHKYHWSTTKSLVSVCIQENPRHVTEHHRADNSSLYKR